MSRKQKPAPSTDVVVAPKEKKLSMEFRDGRMSTREFKRHLATTTNPEARKVIKNIVLGEDRVAYRRGGRKFDRVKKLHDSKNSSKKVAENA